MIFDTRLISYANILDFNAALSAAITEMQTAGMELEIQYRPADKLFTALILGRKVSA